MKPYMELHSFIKGEQIYVMSEKTNFLYFLVKGKFKVLSLKQNGKALLLRFYQPPQILGDLELFGEINLLNSISPLCNLEVLNEAVCIGIPIEIIRSQCMEDVKFLNYSAMNLAKKLIESSSYSSINLLYPLENRLASYMLAISPEDETPDSAMGFATNNLADMADFLGVSYRHLNRTIALLSGKNLIKKEKTYIKILDRKALEAMAGDLYK